MGLLLVLAVALGLIKRHKDPFVVRCKQILYSFPGAKESFSSYIGKVYSTPQIVDAFTENYEYLNETAIEILETAHIK